jgi:ribitol-5-phosphate 2-dehydrogenase
MIKEIAPIEAWFRMRKIVAKEFCLVKPFEFAERERIIESIPKGHLLLKPVVAGICGSEMLYYRGEKEKEKLEKRLPMCLLHEGVAKIVDAGEGAKLKTGTYVVVNPMIPCKKCFACRNLGENFCQDSKYMAATADGLARTLFVYPEERVIPVPSGIELEFAALAEPLSIALNAFEVSDAKKDDRVAIIGDGAIGYLVALIVSHVGGVPKENLYFVGVIDEKLVLAEDFATIINSAKEEEQMRGLTGKIDVAFEAAGGRAHRITIAEAIDLLRLGGRCVLLGISRGEVPVDVTKVVNKGLTFRGSVRSGIEHYVKALEMLKNREFKERVGRIVSQKSFTIETAEDLDEAFRYADTEEGESKTKPGRTLVYFP